MQHNIEENPPETIQGHHHLLLKQWVDEFSDELYARACHITGSRETAQDLVQDTYLAAAQKVAFFRGESSPRTWLHGILKHKIADYFKEMYRRRSVIASGPEPEIDFFTASGDWKAEFAPVQWKDSPDNLLDDDDFLAVLRKCLDRLPEHWRSALLLKFLESRKGEEICQELGITATNFWQLLHRSRRQLRLCLERNWFHS